MIEHLFLQLLCQHFLVDSQNGPMYEKLSLSWDADEGIDDVTISSLSNTGRLTSASHFFFVLVKARTHVLVACVTSILVQRACPMFCSRSNLRAVRTAEKLFLRERLLGRLPCGHSQSSVERKSNKQIAVINISRQRML